MSTDAHDLVDTTVMSVCCGAPCLGSLHEGEGVCSACRDVAAFISEDEMPEPENVPVPVPYLDIEAHEKAHRPLIAFLTKLGSLRYYYVQTEHCAHEAGNTNHQQYCRGAIDAIDAAHKELEALLTPTSFQD